MELTILMPCLNEAETLATCIAKARKFLDEHNVSGEVLIADNGSTDGSQAIAEREGARVVPVERRGYGAALIGGINAAQGRFVIMGDADDSYDFSNLMPFVERLRDGADVVMGNRFKGGIADGAMPFLHRYLGNPVLSWLGRLFFDIKTGDFHCGLRGFNRERILEIGLRTTGMEFASEMVVRAALLGFRIDEVPTTLRPDGRSRPPHLKTWRDGWRHLKFLLMYSPRWLFMIPGLILACLGAVVAAILFPGPLVVSEGLVLDLNSFIFSSFLVVAGIQLMTFGALARYYASITDFLPHSRRANALVEHLTTDRLVQLAAASFLVGCGLLGYAVISWAAVDFGTLTGSLVPRVMIVGMSLMLIGVQMFFSAFLIGILDIPTKRGS